MNIAGIMWSEFCILLASYLFFVAFSSQNNAAYKCREVNTSNILK